MIIEVIDLDQVQIGYGDDLIRSYNIESKDSLVVSFSAKVILASDLPLSFHTLGVFPFSRVRLIEYPQVLRVC